MRILVAEDDPASRRLMEVTLESLGYEAVCVEDGEAAWRLLEQEDAPKLIILDVMMPGLDGTEVCRRIREKKRNAYVYVIMLSAKGYKEDVVDGFRAGADDYMLKPFEYEELRARLKVGERILGLERTVAEFEHERAVLEMAATLGHEINNPLASMLPLLEILRHDLRTGEHVDRETGLQHVDAIERAATRIGDIVRKLIRLSQVRTKEYLRGSSMLDLDD